MKKDTIFIQNIITDIKTEVDNLTESQEILCIDILEKDKLELIGVVQKCELVGADIDLINTIVIEINWLFIELMK